MKAAWGAALLAAAGCAAPGKAQVAYDRMSSAGRDVRMTKVADGIYQFMTLRDGYVRQLNSVAIVATDDVVLFDTGTRPSSAAIILAMIRKLTAKPVRYVINSHAHPDHWSGTQVYADAFPGLEVIASSDTDRFMHLMANVWPQRLTAQYRQQQAALDAERSSGKRADGSAATADRLRQDEEDLGNFATLADEMRRVRRIFPNMVYEGSLRFTHGGRAFDLRAMTGDQDGTTMLYLPKERVVITGDTISYPIPFISARPSRQLASLRAIDALDFATLVPGHGPAFADHGYLRLEIALFEQVIDGVHGEVAAGDADLATVQDRILVDGLRARFTGGDPDLDQRYRVRVRDLVKFAFQEQTGSGS